MDRNILMAATSADDVPTSGYHLNEIAKTINSNLQACEQVRMFLIARLSQNNHNVKHKCLIVIKYLCRNGRLEFKQKITTSIDPIKECLTFSGPADPLRGEENYRKVRDLAKEVLEVIYDGSVPTGSLISSGMKMNGVGNADYVASPVPGSPPKLTAKSSFSGFMSSFSFKTTKESNKDGYKDFNGDLLPKSQNFLNIIEKEIAETENGDGKTTPMESNNDSNISTYQQPVSNFATVEILSVPSPQPLITTKSTTNPLKTVFQSVSLNNNDSFKETTDAVMINRISDPLIPEVVNGTLEAKVDGSYERSIIAGLCESGGLKAVPPEDKLNNFLVISSSLSSEMVGLCLMELLNDDSWQSRTKALIVILKLVSIKTDSKYAEWFAERIEEVKSLENDGKAGVRTQAIKTVRAMESAARSIPPKRDSPYVERLSDMFAGMALAPNVDNNNLQKPRPVSFSCIERELSKSQDLLDVAEAIPITLTNTATEEPNKMANSTTATTNYHRTISNDDMFAGLSFGDIPTLATSIVLTNAYSANSIPLSSPHQSMISINMNSNNKILDCFDFLDNSIVTASPVTTMSNSSYGFNFQSIPNHLRPPAPTPNSSFVFMHSNTMKQEESKVTNILSPNEINSFINKTFGNNMSITPENQRHLF
eukprot:gene6050-8331_t